MLRFVLSSSLASLICFTHALASPSPSPAKASPSVSSSVAPTLELGSTDSLTPADVEAAFEGLKKNYVQQGALSEEALRRAMLAGLLDQLGPSAMLLPRGSPAALVPTRFFQEVINNHVGYLRPGALETTNLQELDSALKDYAGKKVDALVLDLRVPRATDSNDVYRSAADFGQRFVPNGKLLFSLRGPGKLERRFLAKQEPTYHGLLLVLIDAETAGAAEALAGALRLEAQSILIGEPTAGQAVEYSDVSLPSGKVLRFASAEAILSDGRSRFGEGIKPDLPVASSLEETHQIFQRSLTTGMTPFVAEQDRPHLNEAALLAGTNPEIDSAQQRARGSSQGRLRDAPLQRALDLVESIEVYRKQPGAAP